MKRNLKNTLISLFLAFVMVVTYTPLCDFSMGTDEGTAEAAPRTAEPTATAVDETVEAPTTTTYANAKFRIGTNYYENFEDAYEAAVDGDTITFCKADMDFPQFTNEKKITIDGNGYRAYDRKYEGYCVHTLDSLTIKNIKIVRDMSGTGHSSADYGYFLKIKQGATPVY